jgi:hypothetical protein
MATRRKPYKLDKSKQLFKDGLMQD